MWHRCAKRFRILIKRCVFSGGLSSTLQRVLKALLRAYAVSRLSFVRARLRFHRSRVDFSTNGLLGKCAATLTSN